ncbi:MAG: type II CRISPR RNA-guided endonuclease Cas9 [Alphaproteobacteria bacterium]|nr:type II CRISPR RNA-guided endonuclease Cas9 [Alphaproteobacteria bacterium]
MGINQQNRDKYSGKYLMGLDVGVGSLGVALILPCAEGKEAEIIAGTSITFNAAADNSDRRLNRGSRVRFKRRRSRKTLLRDYLNILLKLDDSAIDKTHIPHKRIAESNSAIALRAKALNEKLQRDELFRVFMHLTSHRGVRLTKAVSDEAQKEKGATTKAIAKLEAELKAKGFQTVGQYLAYLESEKQPTRIRRNYQGESDFSYSRDLIRAEFDAIIKKQRVFYPDIFTDENVEKLANGTNDAGDGFGIFWEQGIDANKIASSVGICCYQTEDGAKPEKRIPISSHLFQQKRLMEQINNLKIYQNAKLVGALTLQQRDIVFARAMQETTDITASKIKKWLSLPSNQQLNIDAGAKKGKTTEQKLRPHVALEAISKTELINYWHNFTDEQKETAMELLRDDGDSKENREKWRCAFPELSDALLGILEDVILPAGYAATGKTATQKLLDQLRADVITHDKAEAKAGLKHPKPTADRTKLPYYGSLESLRSYCQGVPDKPNPEHNAEQQFGKIPNPVVHRSLNKIRKTVNAYIKQYGMPMRIHLEMARELNKSKAERDDIDKQNKKNHEANIKYDNLTISYGKNPSRKYRRALRLHEWQNYTCPYTGETINTADIFSGKTEIDHILPYSRTMLDSFSNLVLCMKTANQFKGEKSPYEAFAGGWNYNGKQISYDDILTHIRNYRDGKKKKFNQDAMEYFKDKELFQTRFETDTQYLAKVAHNYLGCLLDYQKDIICLTGGITSDLRHHWGLNNLLQELEDTTLSDKGKLQLETTKQEDFFKWLKENQKAQQKLLIEKADTLEENTLRVAQFISNIDVQNLIDTPRDEWQKELEILYTDFHNKNRKDRSDSRHHLIDAIVIACTNRSEVQRLNTANTAINHRKKEEQAGEKSDMRRSNLKQNHPDNWENFRADVRAFISRPELVVQIPNKNSASRQMHKETNYAKILDIHVMDKQTKTFIYDKSLVSSKSRLATLVGGNQNTFDALTPKKDEFLDKLIFKPKEKYFDAYSNPLDEAGFNAIKADLKQQIAAQAEIQEILQDLVKQAPKEVTELKPAIKDKPAEPMTRKTSQQEKNAWALREFHKTDNRQKFFTYKNLKVRTISNKFLDKDFQGLNKPTRPQRVVQLGNNSHMELFTYHDAKGQQLGWESISVIDANKKGFNPQWQTTYPDAALMMKLRINDTIEIWNDPDADNRKRILTRVQKLSGKYIALSALHRSKTEDIGDPYRILIQAPSSWQRHQAELIQRGLTGNIFSRQKLYLE